MGGYGGMSGEYGGGMGGGYGGYGGGPSGMEFGGWGTYGGSERGGYGGGFGGEYGGQRGGMGMGRQGEGQANFRGHGPKGYQRSDERIREDVCDRLSDNPQLDASGIEVEVNEGEVTLRGTVQERSDKHLAESLVESLPGVKDVTNQIRVESSTGDGRSKGQTTQNRNNQEEYAGTTNAQRSSTTTTKGRTS
jgi:hypothetical protein